MKNIETFIIHFDKLKVYLDSLEKLDPERTWGPLDFARDMIQHNLKNILQGDGKKDGVIEINHEEEEVTILGEPIVGEIDVNPYDDNLTRGQKLYMLFKNARMYTDAVGISSEIFEVLR